MSQRTIIAAVAVLTGLVVVLGVNVINAKSSRPVSVAPASSPITVMQMMKDAKDLPIERFDAH